MKKSTLILSLPCLLAVSIAFSQTVENGKTKTNQAKPVSATVVTKSENSRNTLKPASSINAEHPRIIDKKTVVKQNNQKNK